MLQVDREVPQNPPPSASVPRLHGSTVSISLRAAEALSFLRAISLPTVSSLEPHSSPARLGRVVGEEIK